ncbi:MAG: DUF2254 family protein [Bacillota bacterium]
MELNTVEPYQLKGKKSGYIEYIELEKIISQAAKDNCIVKIEQDLGSYVDQESPLFSIWNLGDQSNRFVYTSFMTISSDQEPIQDVEFGLQKLVEIALRAVSPAINDPYTAINSINHLAKILSLLGKKRLSTPYHFDQHHQLRVIYEKPAFEDYLYECFYQIRHYAKEDVSVMGSLLQALAFIAQGNSSYIKRIIWEFSFYIVEGLREVNWLSMDRQYLNKLLKKIAKVCDKPKREKELMLG